MGCPKRQHLVDASLVSLTHLVDVYTRVTSRRAEREEATENLRSVKRKQSKQKCLAVSLSSGDQLLRQKQHMQTSLQARVYDLLFVNEPFFLWL